MTAAPSPFHSIRWEEAKPRVYYLSSDIRGLIEEPRQAYVIGSRGTGKTTILQALNWQERLRNASLQEQIGEPFAKGHLGLYLKLPDHQLDQFDWWLAADKREHIYASVVAAYLDLLWLPLLIQALDGLRVGGVLPYRVEDERAAVDAVMNELPALYFEDGPASQREPTLRNLRRTLERVREFVVSSARRESDPNDVLDQLQPGGPGAFGRDVAARLTTLCPTAPSGDEWRVFVCWDEGEGLNNRQQLVMNTMVRHAAAPVGFLVSYVARPHEDTRTLNPSIHLQRADRELVFRDDVSDNRSGSFRELTEGVATLRVRQSLGDSQAKVDLDAMLGKRDIDGILVEILRLSDKSAAKDLLDAAAANHSGEGPLPVRQTWLQQRGLDREAGHDGLERRRLSSGRRRSGFMVLLSVCSHLKLKPRYASAEMLLSLSDGCVRDFLWQMDELFKACGLELAQFLAAKVSIDRQHRALLAASKKKASGIEEWLVVAPDSGRRVVEGLAMLTAELQQLRAYDDPLEAEPGLFELVGDGAVAEQAKAYVRDASEAGYLKVIGEPPTEHVRIHLSLAPTFDASYRGGYRLSRLKVDEVAAFAEAADDKELGQLARQTAKRIASQWLSRREAPPPPAELPFTETDEST